VIVSHVTKNPAIAGFFYCFIASLRISRKAIPAFPASTSQFPGN
jgi:hypothetical protein